MRNKKFRILCLISILLVASGLSPMPEGEEFCCLRQALFVPIAMPAGQEADATGMISKGWYGALRESDILDCPIKYEELSWEGRIELDKLVEAIGEASGAPPDPQAREAFKQLLDVEYVWRGILTLDRVDEIEPGRWEEGYQGKKNYVPGRIDGDWTLDMRLVNVHFDETVAQGRASWTGSASGLGSGAVKNLARTVFSPVDDLIYDYERIPWTCEVDPEKDQLSVGDEMSLTIKNIRDSKGRKPKPWQRIVVEVEKGEVTNGTELDEKGCYAFPAGDGTVEAAYEAPEDCRDSGTETVKVYNSCDWGREWVRPMRVTGRKKEIGDGEFEITCDWEGTIESHGKIAEKGVGKGGRSLLAIGLVQGEAQAEVSWKLDVVFKLDRKSDRAKIYELKSARFTFRDTTAVEFKMEASAGQTRGAGRTQAEVKSRSLSPSECGLELIFDMKKKTYRIEGILHVQNITEKGKGEFRVDWPPIRGGEKESGDQPIDYREEILIEGRFSGDDPDRIEGAREIRDDVPPEFMEFMEAIVGNIAGTTRWSLEKKGKH